MMARYSGASGNVAYLKSGWASVRRPTMMNPLVARPTNDLADVTRPVRQPPFRTDPEFLRIAERDSNRGRGTPSRSWSGRADQAFDNTFGNVQTLSEFVLSIRVRRQPDLPGHLRLDPIDRSDSGLSAAATAPSPAAAPGWCPRRSG